MRRKLRIGGIMLIVLAMIVMQLPVESAEAADSNDFVMERMSLASYKGKEKSVRVPSGVEVIGKKAFENNHTMEKVIFPGSLKRIEGYAFWGCDALTDITFGQGLKEVSDYAFTNCKGLKKLTIPSNINSIGIQAFADCIGLTDITIPASVTFIHETAFDGCRKLVIHCEEGTYASRYATDFYRRQEEFAEYEDVPEYTPGYVPPAAEGTPKPEETGSEPEQTPAPDPGVLLGTTGVVGNHAVVFLNNQDPTVHQGVISQTPEFDPESNRPVKYRIIDGRLVADQACYKDKEMKEIRLPDGIREIGEFSFARSSAESLILPDGVEKIAYGAFYHCDNLGAVRLPDTIETVEPKAFDNTLWVKRFLSGESGGEGDFLVSGGVLVAYRGTQGEVRIPDGVRVIAAQCFQGCESVQRVVLPAGLKTIGEGAFESCSALREIVWNDKVEKIADRAFADCAIEETVLSPSVKYLGVGAFDPDVRVSGAQAAVTVYETPSQRLSNAQYREPLQRESGDDGTVGVLTMGMAGAGAKLSGADRLYALRLEQEKSTEAADRARQAFSRNLGAVLPSDAICISAVLTDSSDIPITKLGKQQLTVALPVPSHLEEKAVRLYMYDRNGQLEELAVRYSKNGENYFWIFDTSKVYDLVLVPTTLPAGELSDETVGGALAESAQPKETEVEESFSQSAPGMTGSSAAKAVTPLQVLKWSFGGTLLLAGLFLALRKVQ